MKVRACASPRIMHLVNHYKHAVSQKSGDIGTRIANSAAHVMPDSAVRVINIPNTGRKVRVLKSGKRRITYG